MATRVTQCFTANSTSTTSLSAVYSSNVTNGHTVVLAIGYNSAAGAITGVSDNAGNTYTLRDGGNGAGGGSTVGIWTKTNCSGITTSITLTITASPATYIAAAGDDINTVDGTLDAHTNSFDGNGTTSLSAGPTASVAQTKEFVVAAFAGLDSADAGGAPTFTPGGSYTNGGFATAVVSAGVSAWFVHMEFLSSSSLAGGQTASGSIGTACSNVQGTICTFKDGVFLADIPQIFMQAVNRACRY